MGGNFSWWLSGQVNLVVVSIFLFQMVVGLFLVSKSIFVAVKTAFGIVQTGQRCSAGSAPTRSKHSFSVKSKGAHNKSFKRTR